MIAFITAIAAMIPGIGNIVTSLTNSFFNAKVAMVQARTGADASVASQLVSAAALSEQTAVARLSVIAGSWVLSFLTLGFAVPYMVYAWQCIVYDKIIMHGLTKTDALGGDLSAWGATIIACLFGSGTVLTAGHMYFNRDKTGQ